MSIGTLNATDFFGVGLTTINQNFQTLQTEAHATRASDVSSGLNVPTLMTMGADNQHWEIPAGLVGAFIVFDHGAPLKASQYTYTDTEVVLGYIPASPYALQIAWCADKGGLSRPVALNQNLNLGLRYWNLPDSYGPNVIVMDQGLILERSQYTVQNNMVVLNYTPMNGTNGQPDISAMWGINGPGMTIPVSLQQQNPGNLDLTHFLIPKNASSPMWVLDGGLVLDSQDFTVDTNSGIITLNYVPTTPLKISAMWDYPVGGVFYGSIGMTPSPDGTTKAFSLAQEPRSDTVQLYQIASDGTPSFYDLYTDFLIEGRTLTFINVAPPSGSALTASAMCSVFASTSQVGVTSGDVTLDPAIHISTDTTSETVVCNPDGTVASVTFKDGSASVVATITWTYSNGLITKRVDTGAGKTVTRNYSYSSSGQLLGVSKTVA